MEIARFQRQEHEGIMAAVGLVKDSLNQVNQNIINLNLSMKK